MTQVTRLEMLQQLLPRCYGIDHLCHTRYPTNTPIHLITTNVAHRFLAIKTGLLAAFLPRLLRCTATFTRLLIGIARGIALLKLWEIRGRTGGKISPARPSKTASVFAKNSRTLLIQLQSSTHNLTS